nr:MAG TPA: hypothetical protein [Caudoviricetes sp.]
MNKPIPEFQKIIEQVLIDNKSINISKKVCNFNKQLYSFFKVDIQNINCKKITNITEAHRFVKLNNLENVCLLLIEGSDTYKPNYILTDLVNKKCYDSLYHSQKIVYRYFFTNGSVYMLYANNTDEKKRISELIEKRSENQKGSYLDPNSLFYRVGAWVIGERDASGYNFKIARDRIYHKLIKQFLENDFSYFNDYISNKEDKLYNLYKQIRNIIFRSEEKYQHFYTDTIVCFTNELRNIRKEFLKYKNKDIYIKSFMENNPEADSDKYTKFFEEYCLNEIVEQFSIIMKKEMYFRNQIYNNLKKFKHEFDDKKALCQK